MDNLRACRTCKQIKPTNDYYKSKERKDGLRVNCKSCCKIILQAIPKNKQARSANSKRWADKNREITRQQSRDYRQNNPDKVLNAIHKRNALKRGNGVFQLTAKDLSKLRTGICYYCKSKENITIDHVVPISKGGRHSIGNLISACLSCNVSKGNKLLFEYLQYRKVANGDVAAGSQDSSSKSV